MLTNPVIARRCLALSLGRYRQRAGLTAQELARGMECSAAKISRMEAGIVGVRKEDVEAFALVVDVLADERVSMIEMVRAARQRGWWWEDFADAVPPGSSTFYGLEDGATSIDQHATSLVPGLLQTPDYAKALIGSVQGVSPELAERRLTLRMRRQQILDRAEPPQLTVLLDEAVLFREIGDRNVMIGQWRYLLRRAATSNVVIRVVPFRAAVHPAEGVGFMVLGFDEIMTPVVYAEQPSRNIFIDDPPEVEVYLDALAGAERAAATPDQSLARIEARIRETK